MPTGYTADIAKGISFERFIWTCARAFGALVEMRESASDAVIPKRFEPSDHHVKKLEELRAERERIVGMTNVQADSAAAKDYDEALQSHEKYLAEKRDTRAKYLAMRAKAEAWEPPSAEHEGLREFMVSQIDKSIEFDCSESYMTVPTLQTGSAWRGKKLAEIDRSIKYHHDENAKEISRTEQRNAWLAALRASVPPPTK